MIQAKFVEDINLKKRPLIDILLNGFSVLIFTGALQFIVYPTLGQNLSSKDFGLVLFLMGIANLFGVTFGNTLNNLFLRYAKKSEENEGYFLFSYLVTFFSSSILALTILFAMNIKMSLTIQTLVVLNLVQFRSFFSVEYRIKLNYKKFLIMNSFIAFGYLLGISIFNKHASLFPFLVGETFGSLYIIFSTNLWKAWNFRLGISSDLLKEYLLIIISGLSINAFTYADRFLIKPALGEEKIAIFFSAAIMGKLIGLGVGIISGVFLSYLAQIEEKSFTNYISKIYKFGALAILVLFGSVELITPIAIKILYPKFYDDAIKIHLFVNIGFALKASEAILRPIMIRFVELKKLTLVDSSFALSYVLIGFFVALKFDITGFSIFFMLLSIAKFITQFFVIKSHFKTLI